MTSTNVSNLLMTNAAAGQKDLGQGLKKSDGAIDTGFEKALNAVSNSVSNTGESIKTSTTKELSFNISSYKTDSSKSAKVSIKSKTETKTLKDDDSLSDEDIASISDKLDQFEADVKDAIKEELGVTDEEIDEAMENLGLTVIDLVNPNNLANLFLNLSGQSDSISLVLDDSFSNLLNQVDELFQNLLDDVNISPITMKEIMISMEVTENVQTDENIDVAVEDVADSDISGEEITDEADDSVTEPVVTVKTEEVSDDTEVEDTDEVADETVTVEKSDEAENESENSDSSETDTSAGGELTEKTVDTPATEPETKFEFTYSAKEETVVLPTGERAYVQDMIDQIVDKAQVFSTSESTTMEMTLNPEGLGKIFMEVTQKGDEVTAKIFTENEVVKEALDSQMASLRTQMNDSSTKITSVEVSVGTHEFERNLEEDERGRQQSEDEASKHQSRRKIDLSNLDDLSGMMTEEEQLVYEMMRDNGNTLDYHA